MGALLLFATACQPKRSNDSSHSKQTVCEVKVLSLCVKKVGDEIGTDFFSFSFFFV